MGADVRLGASPKGAIPRAGRVPVEDSRNGAQFVTIMKRGVASTTASMLAAIVVLAVPSVQARNSSLGLFGSRPNSALGQSSWTSPALNLGLVPVSSL